MNRSLLAPRRRLIQYLLLAVYLLLPFLSVSGNPLLRIDLSANTLFLMAMPVRIDEFFLVLLLSLLLTVCFLLMTALLGRVWCGWFCPQTVLNDLVELVGEKLKARKASPVMTTFFTKTIALLLAITISLATIAYFLPVSETVRRLTLPVQYPGLFATFLIMVLLIILDALLVRRSFCHSYCPYGRMQAAFMNDSTLNLAFREEVRDRCIRCNSCVRVCPMGVDIRAGFQIECINCGRCLDACCLIMERKDGSEGLIAYRFGTKAGGRPRLTGAITLLMLATALLAATLIYNLSGRTGAGFAIQRNHQASLRQLTDGSQLIAWKGVIENRSQQSASYRIALSGAGIEGLALQGQIDAIVVAPNQNRTISFFLRHPVARASTGAVELLLIRDGGGVVARTLLPL